MRDITSGRNDLIKSLYLTLKDFDNDPKIKERIIDPIEQDVGNFFLSLSNENGKVTYAKKSEDKLIPSKRIKTSFRRFLRRNLDINSSVYPDAWLDRFGSKVLSYISNCLDERVKILNGDEIIDYYATKACHTCMTGNEHSDKIAFYALNKDKVSLAILDNVYRAFIWNTDEGEVVLDRIYPAGNLDQVVMFRKWAISKGYCYRENACGVVNYNTTTLLNPNKLLHVSMNLHRRYPYLDTFKFGEIKGSQIILSNDNFFGNLLLINNRGVYLRIYRCDKCKTIITNQCWVDNIVLCEHCYYTYYGICNFCGKSFELSSKTELQDKLQAAFGRYFCVSCAEKNNKGIL